MLTKTKKKFMSQKFSLFSKVWAWACYTSGVVERASYVLIQHTVAAAVSIVTNLKERYT